MLLQEMVPFNFKLDDETNTLLPLSAGIGKTWLHPDLYTLLSGAADVDKAVEAFPAHLQHEHEQALYKLFREELVIVLERLRYQRLRNTATPVKIQKPDNWGKIPTRYGNLKTDDMDKLFLKPQADKYDEAMLKKETDLRMKTIDAAEPVMPGTLFLTPNAEILAQDILIHLFPLLKDNTEALVTLVSPPSLPFDTTEYLSKFNNEPSPKFAVLDDEIKLVPSLDDDTAIVPIAVNLDEDKKPQETALKEPPAFLEADVVDIPLVGGVGDVPLAAGVDDSNLMKLSNVVVDLAEQTQETTGVENVVVDTPSVPPLPETQGAVPAPVAAMPTSPTLPASRADMPVSPSAMPASLSALPTSPASSASISDPTNVYVDDQAAILESIKMQKFAFQSQKQMSKMKDPPVDHDSDATASPPPQKQIISRKSQGVARKLLARPVESSTESSAYSMQNDDEPTLPVKKKAAAQKRLKTPEEDKKPAAKKRLKIDQKKVKAATQSKAAKEVKAATGGKKMTKSDKLMSRKLENAERRRSERVVGGVKQIHGPPKYEYLDRKDWDSQVQTEGETIVAQPYFNDEEHVPLAALSRIKTDMPYNLDEDFEDTQKDPALARSEIAKALLVPTQEEFDEQREKLNEDLYHQGIWDTFYTEVQEHVNIKTSTHGYANVVEIGWQPTNETIPAKLSKDELLRGNYVLKVQEPGSADFRIVHPTSDWVEASFKRKVLAAVQKAVLTSYARQPVEVQTTTGKTKIEHERGFVNVEAENVVLSLDNEPINMLKYVPARTVYTGDMFVKVKDEHGNDTKKFALNKKGERIKSNILTEVVHPPKWIGYCRGSQRRVELTNDFVQANFALGFLEQVQKLGKAKKTKFINIPPGDDRQHESVPDHLQTGPKINYRQQDDEKTCLIYSFASALHYAGAKQIASEFYQKAKKISEKHNTFDLFARSIQQQSEHLRFKILNKNQFDIFNNGDRDLVVALLKGSDGKEDPCVTIFGKWIFDSNFDKALPLCQEALDICCSLDEFQDTFESVVEARHFFDYLKLLKGKKQNVQKGKKKT